MNQPMSQYVIERTIPGAGELDGQALAEISGKSNEVLGGLGDDIRWIHSYVVDDKIYCLYEARDEEIIREHGRVGGFPVDSVRAVSATIDPSTGGVR